MPVYSIQLRTGLSNELPGNPVLMDYEPVITSDTNELWVGKSGSAIVPNFNDSDLNTATSNSRPATTRWVQNLLQSFSSTPPSGVAWRTQDNLFTSNNDFSINPTISSALLPIGDNSNRIPTTAWVQQELSSLSNIAFKDKDNTFLATNTFNSITQFNGSLQASGVVDFRGTTWVKGVTDDQTLTPSTNFATSQYVWDSHNNTNKLKYTATPNTTWDSASTSQEIPTLQWIYNNISGSDLLSSNNNWTGLNSFNIGLTTNETISISDNSNKVPNTNWVRSILNSSLSGGKPVLTKDLESDKYNRLHWTNGAVSINGTRYAVDSGSYTFPDTATPGTYYVKAQFTAGTVTIPAPTTSNLMAHNEASIGTLTLADVSATAEPGYPLREIAGITMTPPDYAFRNQSNIFTQDNTFKSRFLVDRTPGNGEFVGFDVRHDTITLATDSILFKGNALFQHTAKSNENIPVDSNDTTLATTQWVQNQLAGFKPDPGEELDKFLFSPNEDDEVHLRTGYNLLSLVGKQLKASRPIEGNDVATKNWVEGLLSTSPNIPIVYPSNGLSITWLEGEVEKPDGTVCTIPAGGPLSIPTSTNYIYVRYSDCSVLPSSEAVDEDTEGKNIATVDTSSTPIEIEPIYQGNWAPIHSPALTGRPTAPKPPADICDDSIATTEWVCDKVDDILTEPCSDSYRLPQVYNVNAPSLLVNVTNGFVPFNLMDLSQGGCDVTTADTPIALVANEHEYVWCRYADCKIVASTDMPVEGVGLLLATVDTGPDRIISIEQAPNPGVETAFSKNYAVGYGGRIIYIGPAEC